MSTKLIEHKGFADKEERDKYAHWLEQNGYIARKYYLAAHKRQFLDDPHLRYWLMIIDTQAPKNEST